MRSGYRRQAFHVLGNLDYRRLSLLVDLGAVVVHENRADLRGAICKSHERRGEYPRVKLPRPR